MTALTQAEKTFFLRMAPHIESGMSFEAAGRAVLDDDMRLVDAAIATDHNLAIQTDDYALQCTTGAGQRGASIRSEMARTVYSRLRAA